MAVHFGRDARLYYNSGTYGSPTWVAINAVRDVAIPDGDRVSIDASGRDYGIELVEYGNLKLRVEGKIRVNHSDTAFAYLQVKALLSTSLSTSIVDLMILSGDKATDGNTGFRFESKIGKWFGEDQNIDQILWRPFLFTPCVPSETANVPASVVVTGSAPVFTTLAV
jgi:hypothetical protein